jgi:hypothetical protein
MAGSLANTSAVISIVHFVPDSIPGFVISYELPALHQHRLSTFFFNYPRSGENRPPFARPSQPSHGVRTKNSNPRTFATLPLTEAQPSALSRRFRHPS